jgi:DNA-binding transcriptional LysR family regulator
MELRQIEAFVSVVKHKTFTLASDHLSLTQPAVTRAVGSLESELGTKLLDRMGRTVALTASGESFLPYAESMLRMADESKRCVADVQDGNAGRLSLASSGTIAAYMLPSILRDFGLRYPKVKLELHTAPSAQVFEMVVGGEVDCGLVMDIRSADGISTQVISNYSHVLITSREFHQEISDQNELVLAEKISNYELITMQLGSTLRSQVETILSQSGVKPKIGLIVDNVETIKRMVRAGLGVAILPDLSVREESLNGELSVHKIADSEGVSQQIAAIHREDRYVSMAMRNLIGMMSSKH